MARLRGHPELGRILLHVTETQVAAATLYRSLGFEEIGRLVGEHRDGERVYDEVVMERDNG